MEANYSERVIRNTESVVICTCQFLNFGRALWQFYSVAQKHWACNTTESHFKKARVPVCFKRFNIIFIRMSQKNCVYICRKSELSTIPYSFRQKPPSVYFTFPKSYTSTLPGCEYKTKNIFQDSNMVTFNHLHENIIFLLQPNDCVWHKFCPQSLLNATFVV